MPLFRRRAEPQSDAAREAAAINLERITAGGIPLGAEARLSEVAAVGAAAFTSDLSVNEFALGHASGLMPVAQVMGSSVVQHGWRNYNWATYAGGIQEMPGFAQSWNLARERAFDRLRQEAQLAGADAVVGIDMNAKGVLRDRGSVEYRVFGTATRESVLPPRGDAGPRLCSLSGQDVDKLRRIGAETLGVIGRTAAVGVGLGLRSNQLMTRWGGSAEIVELTRGVYTARQLAMNEVRRQGRELGAGGMVVSVLRHDILHEEFEAPGYRRHYFVVSLHVLATAIRLGAHAPHPTPLGTPVLSVDLNR